MKTTDPPIIVSTLCPASVEKVWSAITDPAEMPKWFFPQIKSFKPEAGFETEFLVEVEGRKFTHIWKIMEVIPFQKIKYGWRYKEYAGDSFVVFELSKMGNQTELKLTAKILEDFPPGVPEFEWDSCKNGWEYFIQKRLMEYLD